MTGNVINLRTARKRKARDEADRKASENRVRFGRAKAEKQLADKESKAARRHLDEHRLDRPNDE